MQPAVTNSFWATPGGWTLITVGQILAVTIWIAFRELGWRGTARAGATLLLTALVFWAFCFSLSRYSRRFGTRLADTPPA